jgi:hypothetical protein
MVIAMKLSRHEIRVAMAFILLLTSFVVSSDNEPFIETFEYGKTYTASSINIGDTTILLTNSETMNEWPDSFGLSLVENTDSSRRDYFSYKVKRKNQLLCYRN